MGADLEMWTADKLKVIKDQIAPKATDAELEYFAAVCRRTGLDPAARQIYCLHRNTYNPDTKRKEPKMSIQVSIDGLRVIAERAGDYEGTTKAEWCGGDGKWTDIWLDSKPPAAARIGVWRRNFREPLVRTALWTEYRQGFENDNGTFKLTGQWASMPALMLAKCAEALALRAAFPNDMSGLYTADEMGQADNDRGGAERPPGRVGQARADAEPVEHTAKSAPSQQQLPPVPIDVETGEIIDAEVVNEPQTVLAAGQRATEQRRKFAPPVRSQSAENTDRIMAQFADADVAKLRERVAKLDGFTLDDLRDEWKKAALPNITRADAKLTADEFKLAEQLIAKAEREAEVA